jgi:hypothetical protein
VEAPRAYASSAPGGVFPLREVADGITSNVRKIVSTIDDRVLAQVTWIF